MRAIIRRVGPLSWLLGSMKLKRVIVICSVTTLLVLGAYLAFVLPSFYSSRRFHASVVLLSMSSAKNSVTAFATKNKTLSGSGKDIVLATSPKEYALNSAVVTQDGVIFGYNKHYGIAILLEPSLVHGKLSWRCVAMPVESAPSLCRP